MLSSGEWADYSPNKSHYYSVTESHSPRRVAPQCELSQLLLAGSRVLSGEGDILSHNEENERSTAFPTVVYQQVRVIINDIVPCLHSKWLVLFPFAYA